MKNYIYYFYGLNIENLIYSNNEYFFSVDGKDYNFKQCNNLNLDEYYKELSTKLIPFQFFSVFILNKQGNLVTLIDNKAYILLKLNKNIEFSKKIGLSDIRNNMFIEMDSKFNQFIRFPWISFWENKIDYLEEWLINKSDLYKNISSIFNYFIGLSENALQYLKEALNNDYDGKGGCFTVQHFRVNVNTTLGEYYDPTNIVIDHSSRDICEYFKSLWLNDIFDYDVFENYLDKLNVSKNWIMIMYSRILFPSFFFDCFEECIIKNDYNDILYLETKISSLQKFLSKISLLLSNKYRIEGLKWIIKSD